MLFYVRSAGTDVLQMLRKKQLEMGRRRRRIIGRVGVGGSLLSSIPDRDVSGRLRLVLLGLRDSRSRDETRTSRREELGFHGIEEEMRQIEKLGLPCDQRRALTKK